MWPAWCLLHFHKYFDFNYVCNLCVCVCCFVGFLFICLFVCLFFTCITSPSEPTKATMPWSAAKQSIVGVPWKQSIRYVKRQIVLGFESYKTYYILEKHWSRWHYICRVTITRITDPKLAADLNTVIGWSYSIRGGFLLFCIFQNHSAVGKLKHWESSLCFLKKAIMVDRIYHLQGTESSCISFVWNCLFFYCLAVYLSSTYKWSNKVALFSFIKYKITC